MDTTLYKSLTPTGSQSDLSELQDGDVSFAYFAEVVA